MKNFLLAFLTTFLWTFAIAQDDTTYYGDDELEGVQLLDLYTMDMLQLGDSMIYFEWPQANREIVNFEFVTKQQYDAAFYARRMERIPAPQFGRNRGISVELFCDTRMVTLEGNDDDSESHLEFRYWGYIPAMNVLVVQESGYEDIMYSMYDKHSGELVYSMENLPQLSNDHRVLMSLNSSIYSQSATISMVQNGDWTKALWMDFPNWMSSFDGDSAFWAMDGNFYFPVIRSYDRWYESGNLRPCTQFVKLSLVTPEQLAIQKLVVDFYIWHFEMRQYPDFIPSEEHVVNERYTMLDWNNQQLAEDELAATGFFTSTFLSNYHQRAMQINSDLMGGKLEYFQGYLPPYYEGIDFWCNCQDFPEDIAASTQVRVTSLNALGAEVEWSWDDYNWYKMSLQRIGNEWRIDKISGM